MTRLQSRRHHSAPKEDRMRALSITMLSSVDALLTTAFAIASVLVPAMAFAQTAKQIPLRDFFRNPEQVAHQLSEDGKYLSWMAPYERRMNVFVRPLAGGETVRVTSETARSIGGYFWKGERILYVKDFG